MDEFCSAVGDSNQCLHVDGSKNPSVTDQVGVSCENSSGTSYQDDLVCSQGSGEQKGGSVASSASQCGDPSVSGSANEAADDWNNSVFYGRFHVLSDPLNARRRQWVRIRKPMVCYDWPISV